MDIVRNTEGMKFVLALKYIMESSVFPRSRFDFPSIKYLELCANLNYSMFLSVSTYYLDFELWCWRRLLIVPWTARRSNQSI